MSVVIYQIGNVPLNLWASSLTGLEVDIPRIWRGGVERMGQAPLMTLDSPTSAIEPTEVSIVGTIFYSHGRPVQDQLNQLFALGGHPYVDLIAYLPNECCTIGSKCNVCGGKSNRCVTWIHTVAFISEVVPSNTIDEGEPSPIDAVTVDITLTLRDYWRPLNPWLWTADYGGSVVSGLRTKHDLTIDPLPCQPPPRRFNQATPMVFNKKNYDFPFELYHVDVWERTPESVNRGWGKWSDYMVGYSAARWPAPPTSEYQFTNLPDHGTIRINVESESAGTFKIENESTIYLDALSDRMSLLGYGGLKRTDILLATDSIYGPSVVVRDEEILHDVYPIWYYDYEYIGQMMGPINRVKITTPDEDTNSAHLHIYRAY